MHKPVRISKSLSWITGPAMERSSISEAVNPRYDCWKCPHPTPVQEWREMPEHTRPKVTTLRFSTATTCGFLGRWRCLPPVSYTHLRAHETPEHLVCRLLL